MGKKNGKPGRKPRFLIDGKLIDEICGYLAEGCSVRTACEVAGLGQSTFHQ
jgi:hypothetical protein